ncbi:MULTISPECIES: helix-turn-helix transcriptional regulator [unclassified Sphingopyxis]|uniref:helix-turn-helix transcriptional regulator n=1 Tax=unclassified Sphingopyxis TaxID=2614943 RepID=UPI002F407C5D
MAERPAAPAGDRTKHRCTPAHNRLRGLDGRILRIQIGLGSVKAKTGYAMEPERFLRMQSVLDRTGLSRATLYRQIRDGSFPHQLQLTRRCVAWRESEVQSWMAERFGERADNTDAPPRN